MEILNRKARHDYFIDDTIECGIVLTGTEIKSIRGGSANIKDCYAEIKNDEIFLINMFIALIKKAINLIMKRRDPRKLLLHKNQIRRLKIK